MLAVGYPAFCTVIDGNHKFEAKFTFTAVNRHEKTLIKQKPPTTRTISMNVPLLQMKFGVQN